MRNLGLAMISVDVAQKLAVIIVKFVVIIAIIWGIVLFLSGLLSFSLLGIVIATFGAILFFFSLGYFLRR